MKRTIQAKVIGIKNEDGETPRVILQCNNGETIAPKAHVTATAMLRDQESLIAAKDRISVVGKGRPSVRLGDTVEVQVVSDREAEKPRSKTLGSTTGNQSDDHDHYGDDQDKVDQPSGDMEREPEKPKDE